MISKQTLFGALIAAAGWVAGGAAAYFIFAGSPAVSAYVGLVGWWFAAYLASKFVVPISSTIPLGVVYFILFVIAALLEKSWFYHDIAGVGIGWVALLALAQSIVIASPILFDWTVSLLKRRFLAAY